MLSFAFRGYMKKGLLKKILSVFLSLAMMFAAAGCTVPASAENTGGLVISEVVTSNSNSLKDPIFGQPDWISFTTIQTVRSIFRVIPSPRARTAHIPSRI